MTYVSRVTTEILRAGQPRAYADSETVARVTFESTRWDSSSDRELHPSFLSEETASRRLLGLQCGFCERRRGGGHPLETYLDYLRPVDGRPASEVIQYGDPDQIVASVWEFRVVSPFTD